MGVRTLLLPIRLLPLVQPIATRLVNLLPKAQLDDLSNLYYAPVIEIGVGMKHTGNVHWNAFGGLVPSKEQQKVLGILMPSACFVGRSPEEGATYAFFVGGARHPEYLIRLMKS